MSILQKHPEILTFKDDQKNISEPVQRYLDELKNDFPSIHENLNIFRELFSQIDQFSEKEIENLITLPIYTFSERKLSQIEKHLTSMFERYPVPKRYYNSLNAGISIDLRDVEDEQVFTDSLHEFIDRVDALEEPEPIQMDLDSLGNLSLEIVHTSSDSSYEDPIIGNRLNKIWTFDPSTNPGVSVKDVMAQKMIKDAISSKKLRKGQVIVEGTSGNTGAGMAIIAANLGYKIILVIPDKMSQEKIDRLSKLGAHVIVTPTSVSATDIRSYYSVRDYVTENICGWTSSQYHNLSNRTAHEEVTGPLILEKTQGEVSAVVITAGTCGTVSGVGRFLKKENSNIKVIAVDTVGSILYLLKEGYTIDQVEQYATGYKIQGFGEDIHPKNLDLSVIDHFIRISDATGFAMSRVLPAVGFPYGHSSGAAYGAILEALDDGILNSTDNVVTIFPDSGLPYRKDVYNDQWMTNNDFGHII